MHLPAGFLMRIADAANSMESETGMMCIIIRRPYAHLEKELRSAFEGQPDVRIVIDRRHGERRTKTHPVSKDRRGMTRRRPKEELVNVVIST